MSTLYCPQKCAIQIGTFGVYKTYLSLSKFPLIQKSYAALWVLLTYFTKQDAGIFCAESRWITFLFCSEVQRYARESHVNEDQDYWVGREGENKKTHNFIELKTQQLAAFRFSNFARNIFQKRRNDFNDSRSVIVT